MKAKPRQQHYLFAHHLLRSDFFRDPSGCISSLERQGLQYLLRLWDRAAMVDEATGMVEELVADGLDYEIRDLPDGTSISLISLPPAVGCGEAWMLALVFRPYLLHPAPVGQSIARYLTLERVVGEHEDVRTILAEWTADRQHVSLGSGPQPDVDELFLQVMKVLEEGRSRGITV